MISEFCPICGSIMEKVPMNIHGTVYDFWVCPEGDWEAPARAGTAVAAANAGGMAEKINQNNA